MTRSLLEEVVNILMKRKKKHELSADGFTGYLPDPLTPNIDFTVDLGMCDAAYALPANSAGI